MRGESGSTVHIPFSQSRILLDSSTSTEPPSSSHPSHTAIPPIPRACHVVLHHPETLQSPQLLNNISDPTVHFPFPDEDPPHAQQAQVLEVPAWGSVGVAQVEEEPPHTDSTLVFETEIEALELQSFGSTTAR
ncbi:hypothetical protein EYR40_007383 [Pleurotus pulmonarius]|nr:hypothetical protein EYR36_008220 [Pleurotus pulmonarius]KAF4580019.1 hypothetical protein EYR36_001839 [Pleurotus pulmonarius]KAF4596933.1 hypothetical protein EYR40_007383 [Pleurotus pulmonarius]